MALVIDLKPQEKIIIGDAVITNDKNRARLHIAGDAPILREKDIMLEKDADTPCKRVYLALQLMYLSHKPQELHETYFELIKQVQAAAPSTAVMFMKINDQVLDNKYYKALKEAQKLIEYERELLNNGGE